MRNVPYFFESGFANEEKLLRKAVGLSLANFRFELFGSWLGLVKRIAHAVMALDCIFARDGCEFSSRFICFELEA
jgi:hypothetical protein